MNKKVLLYIICLLILSIEFDYSLIVDENSINIRQINICFLLILSFLPKTKLEYSQLVFPKNLIYILGSYILYCGLSALWSFDASETIGRWLGLVMCLVISYNIVSRYQYSELIKAFVVIFSVTLVLSWMLYFSSLQSYAINKEEIFRFKGIYSHAMRLALIISVSIISMFCNFTPFKSKYINVILFLFLLATLFLTKSRTFITFTFLVSLLIYADTIKQYIILYVIPLALILTIFVFSGATSLLFSLYQRGDSDITELTGRTFVWTNILPLIEKKLLLGYGYGSFKSHPLQYNSWIPEHAHNIWLHQAYETGIIGSILFTAFLAYAFFSAIRFRQFHEFSFLKYFLAFVILAGMTGVPVGANASILYFLLLCSTLYESMKVRTKSTLYERKKINIFDSKEKIFDHSS